MRRFEPIIAREQRLRSANLQVYVAVDADRRMIRELISHERGHRCSFLRLPRALHGKNVFTSYHCT
jgi:hypothetical protein